MAKFLNNVRRIITDAVDGYGGDVICNLPIYLATKGPSKVVLSQDLFILTPDARLPTLCGP